jgi:6,7-dimethyl-8-ribityllumazine synthase
MIAILSATVQLPMLKRAKRSRLHTNGGVFAIVASRYNPRYVDGMLAAAQRCLRKAGAADIIVVRVPGAYEVPLAVARLARAGMPSLRAIICLGVILRGATAHAQNIGEVITSALMQIQLEHEIPVVHEVLLLENRQQAEERCLGHTQNRGLEAAQTAMAMARVIQKLQTRGPV